MRARGTTLLVTTCVSMVLAGSLHAVRAADLPVKAPPLAAPAVSFTGVYLGGEIGTDFSTARFSRPQTALSDISIGSADHSLDGGIYGGFNYQVVPWLVLGAEGELTSLGSSYREIGPDFDFLQNSRYMVSVAGRIGLVVMPRTMVYGKAGPAWINVGGMQGFGTPFDTTVRGLMVAGGVESLLLPNLAVRAEASYTRANDPLLLNAGFDQYRPEILQLKVGAAAKFGVPGLGDAASVPAAPLWATDVAPRWTAVEIGGFGSLNGNQMRFNGPFAGENNEQGPFTDLVAGGGGFLGAHAQIASHIVVGVEASANFQKASFNTAAGVGLATPIFHFADINNVYAVTARGGWLVSPSTLFYVKGGVASIRVSPDLAFWNAIAPNTTQPTSLTGAQVGVGAETFVTSNFSVRLEGLFTSTLDQLSFQSVVPNTPFTIRPSQLSAQLGAAVHF